MQPYGGVSMACRDVIFVVGTGRAGTSALTRILSLCGCTLPESVLGPADYNPKGSWEPTYTRKLTAEFLAHHGIIGLDPTLRLEGEISLDARGRKEYIEQLTQFLANCPTGRILL